MNLLAVTLSRAVRLELSFVIQWIAELYVLLSFIGVVAYSVTQARAGRLLRNANNPPPWMISPVTGWFFVLCILNLLFLQSFLYMVLIVLGTAFLLIENRRSVWDQFGLERMSPISLFKWSLYVCGAVILIELPLIWGSEKIMTALHIPHPEQESVMLFRQFNRPAQIFDFLLQAVVISPMIEELFFRGFLLTFLKNYTSPWLALLLSAGVFAFAHVNLGSALPLWFLGIVLGIAYEHTGCLLLPIGIHACFNLMTAVSLLLDKGVS
ncbi:MAG: CPBP family intramembrane metalloprotease [Methylacidiphilales bacterium]|nr:CPBP family intramembrane metalloprotease [Candidatus Methylacidiphilales bacterium]